MYVRVFFVVLFVHIALVFGGPTLPNMIGDNMVLQRGSSTIWGRSSCVAPSATVSVQVRAVLSGVQVGAASGQVAGGVFRLEVALPDAPTTETYELLVTDCSGTTTKNNVLIGDVFLCSGQSNMERSVAVSNEGASAAAGFADHSFLRMFSVQRIDGKTAVQFDAPTRDNRGWCESAPESFVGTFDGGGHQNFFPSAICFYAAREIYRVFQGTVPVGFVGSARGGATLQSFMNRAAAEDATCGGVADTSYQAPWSNSGQYELYNAMLAPFFNMKIKALMWYQGEADVGHNDYYMCAFPAFISMVRAGFGVPNMPFYFAQLAGLETNDDLSGMRAAQMNALQLTNVGYVVTIDNGDRGDIHPRDKLEVGRRFAMQILLDVYAKDVDTTGPEFERARMEDLNGVPFLRVYFKAGTFKSPSFVDTKDCTSCCAPLSGFEVEIDNLWIQLETGAFTFDSDSVLLDTDGRNVTGVRLSQTSFVQCALSSQFGCAAGTVPASPFPIRALVSV
jgi:sialate O-acetylesterase